MQRNNRIVLSFFLLLCLPWFSAQEVLSHEKFLSLVKEFHPTVKQAKLQNRIANNQIKSAQGQLDPVLSGKLGEKVINGVGYYNEKTVGLEIPTWYGITIVGQSSILQGNKLDNSQTKGDLQQLGVEIPIGKGLLFDQRRATIQQAKIFAKMTENEQRLIINDVLLEATNSYVDWWTHHELLKINDTAYQNNLARLKMIAKSVELGERPAIDTVEAKAQLQFFELRRNESQLNFRNATLALSVFLWNENGNGIEIPENIVPEDDFKINEWSVDAMEFSNHPAIEFYRNKQTFLEVEKRLKFQSLLPKLDFAYNFFYKDNSSLLPLFRDNFQYGLKLEIPVFLRSARADYENAKLKLQQNDWQFKLKQTELQTKFFQYQNDFNNYIQQNDLAQKNTVLYQQLLNGENTRFLNGEGSVFLINSRELKLMEAKEKLTELRAKQIKTYYKIMWIKNDWNFLQ